MNDTSICLDDKVIDEHLLSVFVRSHQNDLPDNPMPETNKYPPTNETMLIIPPEYKNWNQTQQRSFAFAPMGSNISPLGMTNAGMISSAPTQITRTDDAIIVITFKFDGDELSVMVEDTVTVDSSMEEVMEEGDIFDEFNKESQFKIQFRS